MASIDYQEARKEIIRLFGQQEASGRKIIFWYDPPANFKEDIVADSYDCCKIPICRIRKIRNSRIFSVIF